MKKMPARVLHLISNLGPGGAQVLLRQIAKHLDRRRFETFICPLRRVKEEIDVGAPLLRLDYRNYDPRKLSAIGRVCKEHKIDLIHAHLHKGVLAGLLVAPKLDIPVIIHEHGPAVRSGPQYALYRFLLKRLWRRASAVIAISRHIGSVLETRIGIAPAAICLLHNAVDFAPFENSPQLRSLARRQLGFDDNDIVLGFAGRLAFVKGADIAIKTLKILSEKSSRYRLLVIGSGPQHKKLQRLADRLGLRGKVRFAGFCAEPAQLMAAADIALVPSRQEPFGLVGLEWMRMKIPVVSSGAGGLGEYMHERQTALIADSNLPRQAADCILELADNRSLCSALIEQAHKITENYHIAPYIEKMQRLYDSLLNK